MERASAEILINEKQQFSDENTDDVPINNVCEVFTQYKPSYLRLGCSHPQQLCEGTGLSCVKPPKISYSLKMEKHFYTSKMSPQNPHLSDAQLEAIVYACQSHEDVLHVGGKTAKKGFYLGDGTGTGKSRTIAGILYEGHKQGVLNSVWVTANTGLFETCKQEIRIFLPSANFFEVACLRDPNNNVTSAGTNNILFLTYHSLIDSAHGKNSENGRGSKIGLINKWITANAADGYMIFDEAHNAKSAHDDNVKQSQTGKAVVKLQNDFPSARVVYSSATGASEPNHLWYFQRLGLWGDKSEHKNMEEFQSSLEKRGYGGLELLALEMKMSGVFMSRQISFKGVNLEYHETRKAKIFEEVYNRSCDLWSLMLDYLEDLKDKYTVENKRKDIASRVASMQGPFYASALTFFASLNMSSKLSKVDNIARKALSDGQSVIVGLQHTGDAKFDCFKKEKKWTEGFPYSNAAYVLRHTLISMGVNIGCPKAYFNNSDLFLNIGEWDDDDEYAADALTSVTWNVTEDDEDEEISGESDDDMENSEISDDEETDKEDFMDDEENPDSDSSNEDVEEEECTPPFKKLKSNIYTVDKWPAYSVGSYVGGIYGELFHPRSLSWSIDSVSAHTTKQGLARLYHELALLLPINPIDEFIARMANTHKGESYEVAELTGRRETNHFNGERWEVKPKDDVKSEMDKFMNLKKRVCVISSIASTGFSLHSDLSRKNKQKRVHITLEYSWGPDQLLQQLGRSHRSNQAVVPKYVIVRSPIPGEVRYVSVVAKRLMQLGAICQGQTMANPLHSRMSDVLCTDLGVQAINSAIRILTKDLEINEIFRTTGLKEIKTDDEYFSRNTEDKVSRCFNRCLFLHLDLQQKFLDQVDTEMERLKKKGFKEHYHPLVEFGGRLIDVELLSRRNLISPQLSCELYKFRLSRILTQPMAAEIYRCSKKASFYVCGSKVMLAVDTGDGCLDAYYPYNRNPTKIVKSKLTDWVRKPLHDAYAKWDYNVTVLKENPGCEHKLQKTKCKKTDCMYNWGIHEILIISGFTGFCLKAIENRCEERLRLAKVCYSENGQTKCCVGVLIEAAKNREVEQVLCARFLKQEYKNC